MDSLHPAFNKICNLLDSKEIKYEYFTHPEVRTSEEAVAIRPGFTLHQGAKALIIRISGFAGSQHGGDPASTNIQTPDSSFVLCVLPADYKLDNAAVRKTLGIKDFRFANPEEVEKLTRGVKLGGIPPFGSIFGIPTYCDPELLHNEVIIFNAGDRRVSLHLKARDWQLAENPIIAQVAKKP